MSFGGSIGNLEKQISKIYFFTGTHNAANAWMGGCSGEFSSRNSQEEEEYTAQL